MLKVPLNRRISVWTFRLWQPILVFQRITSPITCLFPSLPECSRHSGWISSHLPPPHTPLCKRWGQYWLPCGRPTDKGYGILLYSRLDSLLSALLQHKIIMHTHVEPSLFQSEELESGGDGYGVLLLSMNRIGTEVWRTVEPRCWFCRSLRAD